MEKLGLKMREQHGLAVGLEIQMCSIEAMKIVKDVTCSLAAVKLINFIF